MANLRRSAAVLGIPYEMPRGFAHWGHTRAVQAHAALPWEKKAANPIKSPSPHISQRQFSVTTHWKLQSRYNPITMSNASLALRSAIQYQEAHIHDSRVSAIRVSAGVCLSVAYIAVILRVLSRRLGRVSLQSDDQCIIAGLVGYPQSVVQANLHN